jgi:hypothetical protein
LLLRTGVASYEFKKKAFVVDEGVLVHSSCLPNRLRAVLSSSMFYVSGLLCATISVLM